MQWSVWIIAFQCIVFHVSCIVNWSVSWKDPVRGSVSGTEHGPFTLHGLSDWLYVKAIKMWNQDLSQFSTLNWTDGDFSGKSSEVLPRKFSIKCDKLLY